MKKNVWKSDQPLFVQAPMENVTDSVFRQIIAKCAKPDIFFTEFTNADGLCSEGSGTVARRLQYTALETPIIAQIWGSKPEYFYLAAKMIQKMGFDGIDINMGCPDKTVTKKGLCSALINNHTLAHEIIVATRKGASNLPVSVKTRIGYSKIETENWISFLLSHNLDAIIVHGRTAKEMSKVANHWDEIGKCVTLRDRLSPHTVLIGNGDIQNQAECYEKIKKHALDGIMIGRGIFHDISIFNKNPYKKEITVTEKIVLLMDHLTLFDSTWGESKDFNNKFFKIYINEIPYATDIREKLIRMKFKEQIRYLKSILQFIKTEHQFTNNIVR